MPSLHGGHWLTHSESRGIHHYAIALADHKFLDQPFIVGLELDTAGDPQIMSPQPKLGTRQMPSHRSSIWSSPTSPKLNFEVRR